jgi:lysine 2,3-aminomutase
MSQPAFRELITPFLRGKLADSLHRYGPDSDEYRALARQYIAAPEEQFPTEETNLRHYEADVSGAETGLPLRGIERLYKQTLVVEPTLSCAAHCRYCIRANYPRRDLNEDDLAEIARYCGNEANRHQLTEVLVTGGDPLLLPRRVAFFLDAIASQAPNIRVVRIATRLPFQAPALVNDDVMRLFDPRPNLRIELATQINHSVELFPEVADVLRRIRQRGVCIYAQNILLRGVNDRIDALVNLYDALRRLDIEAHYLFHCVPLAGIGHLRTGLDRLLELGTSLACDGALSGRAKPLLTVMTDIGKIVLYHGVVSRRDGRLVLLKSRYRLADRRRWNPGWVMPPTAEIDEDGYLRVWYLDGEEPAETTRPFNRRPVRRRPIGTGSALKATAAPRQRLTQLTAIQPCR